jgi:hypothetical protein
VPGGERADQSALAVPGRQRDQLLALGAEQGPGDLLLERLQLESDPISEIDEGSERFLAFSVSHGDLSEPPSRIRERFSKSLLRSALPGGPNDALSQKTAREIRGERCRSRFLGGEIRQKGASRRKGD